MTFIRSTDYKQSKVTMDTIESSKAICERKEDKNIIWHQELYTNAMYQPDGRSDNLTLQNDTSNVWEHIPRV